MLRFIHLMKTGGSSLRHSFMQEFGMRVAMDYPNFRTTHLKGLDPEKDPEAVREALRSTGAEVLIGHEAYSRYANIIEPENTIVFIRHPVDRMLSNYHMKLREDPEYPASVQEFARIDPNHQTRLIQDLPLDVAFVGVFEDYQRSIERLNARYGLQLEVKYRNRNPNKQPNVPYSVDADTYAELSYILQEDMRMYDSVVRKSEKPWKKQSRRWDPPKATPPRREYFESVSQAFDRVYRTREWGVGSGEGSNPQSAKPYVEFLQSFLRDHDDIQTVLDCGCGDLQMANSIDWTGRSYLGIDASSEVLKQAKARAPHLQVEQSTIAIADRSFDLAIVKEVFQHLPYYEIHQSLLRLKGCKYLLITNDVPQSGSNVDIRCGGYRPLDMEKSPFNLEAQTMLEYVVGKNTKRVLLVRQ